MVDRNYELVEVNLTMESDELPPSVETTITNQIRAMFHSLVGSKIAFGGLGKHTQTGNYVHRVVFIVQHKDANSPSRAKDFAGDLLHGIPTVIDSEGKGEIITSFSEAQQRVGEIESRASVNGEPVRTVQLVI